MTYISARNISLVYPLVGRDRLFSNKVNGTATESRVGGRHISTKRTKGILALDNLNLEINTGDRIGILGENGSGKSSLLRVLGGIYPPTSGVIEIGGRAAGLFSLRNGINKEVSGIENIKLKGLMYGLKRSEIIKLIPGIIQFSELGEFIHMPVKTYSTGMVMRLLFATLGALNPDILLLDEWISTGDKRFNAKVNNHLEILFERTPIVIIASHNEKRIKNWANEIITLNKGKAVL